MGGEELMQLENTQEETFHEERIVVSVRLRPLNTKEIARNDVSDWECINESTLIYGNSISERSMYPNAYTFDRVFRHDCPTKQVYEVSAKKVALSVVSGINASIFAYGQTSSGKTYTMSGITEFTVEDIYEYVQRHAERAFVLKFSAMEIYNEAVRDLLSTDSTPLRLLDDPERGTVVDRLTEETLRDLNHLKELLSVCETQRQIGETSLNETSSRSHQILRLTIESSAREFLGKDNSSTLSASVDFVDLAGSERASQTLSAGARLKEGCHINRSLLTLGTVIRKLSKGRSGHIPYRDSKLTRILQCSLGGNARTAIICTISPARSHVEQSRNTLTFASCAKEVATNAQVNVVMSDKTLVKHLQRELARLESELKGLEPTSATCDPAALLREKDLQIEKMEKEIQDLTHQRDLAQSRLDNLADNDQSPPPHTPNRLADEDSISVSVVADRHYLAVGVNRFNTSQDFNRCRKSSFDEKYLELTEIPDDQFLFDLVSPKFSTISPKFVGPDPCKAWEGITEVNGEDFEEICKEVQCIEIEESSTNRNLESSALSPEESEGMLPLTFTGNRASTDHPLVSSSQKGDRDLKRDDAESTYGSPEMKFQYVQKTIDCLVSPWPYEPSQRPPRADLCRYRDLKRDNAESTYGSPEMKFQDVQKTIDCHETSEHPLRADLSSSRSLKLTRSRSCRSSLTTSSSPLLQVAEKNENTPPSGSEKDFPGRPTDFERKLSSLNYNSNISWLSRENSFTSERSDLTDELKEHNIKTSSQEDVTSIHRFVAGLKEMTKLQYDKQLADDQVQESEPKTNESKRTVKDVGLDPVHNPLESPSSWPLEFERQQREIIELWQTCNVSLVHRTYFFLLFKGDPSDSIYMEVERRRLAFLKDIYSQGQFDKLSVEGALDRTPASSTRALHRERVMLCKQMQKRLTEEERDKLYQKWGIGLKTKQRRLQLAHLLWTDTKDMDNIMESASLVAKLVGLLEPREALKEMFGLSFTPQKTSRRSHSWRSSRSSFL